MASALRICVLDLNSDYTCNLEFESGRSVSKLTVREVKKSIAAHHPFLLDSIHLAHRGALWHDDDSPLFLLVDDFFETREIVLYYVLLQILRGVDRLFD
jgi:hypothetical protein